MHRRYTYGRGERRGVERPYKDSHYKSLLLNSALQIVKILNYLTVNPSKSRLLTLKIENIIEPMEVTEHDRAIILQK
jgi:hypothetical protein